MYKEILKENIEVNLDSYFEYISKIDNSNINTKLLHKHHIIPRYMKKHFDFILNANWNLIYVTPQEHYDLHLILANCFDKHNVHYHSNINACLHLTKNLNLSDDEILELKKTRTELNLNMWETRRDELLFKMREANKTSQSILNKSKANKKKWEYPEYRKKSCESIKKIHNTTEVKLKHSKASQKNWEDVEYSNNMRTKIKESQNSPEYLEMKSNAMKDIWNNDKFKTKISIANGTLVIDTRTNKQYLNKLECREDLNITSHELNKLMKSKIIIKPIESKKLNYIRISDTKLYNSQNQAMKDNDLGYEKFKRLLSEGMFIAIPK